MSPQKTKQRGTNSSFSEMMTILQEIKKDIVNVNVLNKDEEAKLEASIEKAVLDNGITFAETQDKI